MSQQSSIQDQIIARAMKDEAFRQKLLSNPKAAIERELRIAVPQGVVIMVHESTPTTIHLVLPGSVPPAASVELSDAELERVVGGEDDHDWGNASGGDQGGSADQSG